MRTLFAILALALASLGLGAENPDFLRFSRPGVSILGDSYSTFEGHVTPDTNYVWYFKEARPDKTDVDRVQQLWWYRLIEKCDLRLVVNNSFSGSTISTHGYQGADYSDRSFVTRAPYLGSPDIILVFGATNDSWAGAPADGDTLDALAPSLEALFASLAAYYPATPVYFILNTELRGEINDACAKACEKHKVSLVRLKDIDKKAGHPTVKGMEQIAAQVEAALKGE